MHISKIGVSDHSATLDNKQRAIILPLTFLLNLTQHLSQATDLVAALETVVTQLQLICPAAATSLFLLSSNKNRLIRKATAPVLPLTNLNHTLDLNQWPTLTTWLEQETLHLFDTDEPAHQATRRTWSEHLYLNPPPTRLYLLPLHTQGQVMGLLSLVDNQTILTPEIIQLLLGVARQTALLIERFTLYQERQKTDASLWAAFTASNALVSSQDPGQVLQEMVDRAQAVAQASGVRMVLIDPVLGEGMDLIATGNDRLTAQSAVRPHGLSMQIMRSGQPQLVMDARLESERVNPTFFSRGVIAAAGLPVSVNGEAIGVVWVYYDQPQHFSETDINALQLYVNQAAIAYDNARRMKQLGEMRQAAAALAQISTLSTILHEAVRLARLVLDASSAVIWFYDSQRQKFMPDLSVADGVPESWWEESRRAEPHTGGHVSLVMERGWISVNNVPEEQSDDVLGQATQQRLIQIGVQSYQGIALTVGDTRLGVLFLNYNRRRHFSSQEQATIRTFAHHVALALNNARLLEQFAKVTDTAGTVATMSVLAALSETLKAIADGMYNALRCDIVTLYVYDEDKERLQHPPTIIGRIRYPDRPQPITAKGVSSLLFRVIGHDDLMYIADDVRTDPWFSQSRFSRDEEIASCIGVALRSKRHTVGVMFINYRKPHRFTSDEITHIRLFADQAAVAIHNAQMLEKEQKHSRTLRALDRAAHAVTGALSQVDEVLSVIAEQAWQLTGVSGRKARFSHLALVEGEHLVFQATYPREQLALLRERVGKIFLHQDGRIGVTGQAVQQATWVLVGDVARDKSYIEYDPETCSELAVPIKKNGQVIGVINVEHPEPDAFDYQDIVALSTLAEYATAALENSRLFEQLRQQHELLQMLHEAAQAVTASLEPTEILSHIARQASKLVLTSGQLVSYTSIWRQSRPGRLQLMATFPEQEMVTTWKFVNGELDVREGKDGRVGVIGRVMHTGQLVRLNNVELDADYLASHPETRSEVAVPIKRGQDTIGVINVEHTSYAAFSEADEQALTSLAAWASISLHNADLYHKEIRHAQLLDAAAKVAGQASSTLDELQLLKIVVDLIPSHFPDFYHAAVFMIDPERAYANLKATSSLGGQRMLQRHHRLRIGQEGIVGHVAYTGIHYLSPDIQIDPHHSPSEDLPNTRAEMAFPLRSRLGVIGVLDVQSLTVLTLPEEDIATLQAMADQLANAILNARFYNQMQKRAAALQALHEAGQAAASARKIDQVLATIVEQAWRLTETTQPNSQSCALALATGTELQFVAAYPPHHLSKIQQVLGTIRVTDSQRRGISGRTFLTGEPQLVNDVSQDPDYLATDDKTRSNLIVPIKVDGQVQGVIVVEHDWLNAFDNDDLQALLSLAAQAGIALQNTNIFREARLLQDVAAQLSAALTLDEVITLVLRTALDLTNINDTSLLFWDAAANRYQPAYKLDAYERKIYLYQTTARIGRGYTHQILTTRRPIIISDTHEDPLINPITIQRGRRCVIGVPLLSGSEAIGVLYAHGAEPRQFSQHQQTILETLCNLATTAIHRVKQYEELRQTYEELRQTNQLMQARTALAFMGMDSGTRVHAIRNHARTIYEQIQHLRDDLGQPNSQAEQNEVAWRLSVIERQAEQILERRPTWPLAAEEGMTSVYVNEFVQERARQLWENGEFQVATLLLELNLSEEITVRVSPEWLRRAFDMLVENAVEAVRNQLQRFITIGTAAAANGVHLHISDTGTGLPEEIQAQIGLILSEHPHKTNGLGMGLVMAQLIVQAYGGNIQGYKQAQGGTTMTIYLPVEESEGS